MSILIQRLPIQITQEDIDKGSPGDVINCPIALAFKRTFPTLRVLVDQEAIQFWDYTSPVRIESTSIPMPRSGAAFIKAFDSSHLAKPFTLHLPACHFEGVPRAANYHPPLKELPLTVLSIVLRA